MAMAMLQTLHVATGGRLEWRGIDQVVLQPEHFEALEYAVGQQWIEVSAVFRRFALQKKAGASRFGNAGRHAITVAMPPGPMGRASRA